MKTHKKFYNIEPSCENGATTLNIMTLRRAALGVMTLTIMTYRKMSLSKLTLRIVIFSTTIRNCDNQHNNTQHNDTKY
jgi:hypothetical protein